MSRIVFIWFPDYGNFIYNIIPLLKKKMYILLTVWDKMLVDPKMFLFNLLMNAMFIILSFVVLDLCPIILFQKLGNTLYMVIVLFNLLPYVKNKAQTSVWSI